MSQHHYNKNPYYRYFQAYSAFERGQFDLSLSNLDRAIKLNKNEPTFYYLLAVIYEKTDRPEQALDARAKGEKIEKNAMGKNKHRRIHNSATRTTLDLISVNK